MTGRTLVISLRTASERIVALVHRGPDWNYSEDRDGKLLKSVKMCVKIMSMIVFHSVQIKSSRVNETGVCVCSIN